MFVGTVSCEIEVGKAQSAFRGFRMLLVEPEHKVDWEGPVVAIDTVQARVGDLVVVALAPFGPALDIPADLPVEAAVVAIVRSLSGAVAGGGSGVGVGSGAGAPPSREPAAMAQRPSPRLTPMPVGEQAPPQHLRSARVLDPGADVVPQHIRSLMEGSPARPGAGSEGPMEMGGDRGPRRRRRRGRGGRGRPDHLPESEGEFLEDESRFEPEPAVGAMAATGDAETRPERGGVQNPSEAKGSGSGYRPERAEHRGGNDEGRGDRGDRGPSRDRPGREQRDSRGPDREHRDRPDFPRRPDRDLRPMGTPPPRETEFGGGEVPFRSREPEFRSREPEFRAREPETPRVREPEIRSREPEFRPREPQPQIREPEFRPREPEPRVREPEIRSREPEIRSREPEAPRVREPDAPRVREPEAPRVREPEAPRVREPIQRPREHIAGEGAGSGVVWGSASRPTEGFSIGEGASAGMSSGVRRPRKKRR